MALAMDALQDVAHRRGDAEARHREATAELDSALASMRDAVSYQNEALRQFYLAGDVTEN